MKCALAWQILALGWHCVLSPIAGEKPSLTPFKWNQGGAIFAILTELIGLGLEHLAWILLCYVHCAWVSHSIN